LITFTAVEVMNLYVSKLCKATLNVSTPRGRGKYKETTHDQK